MHRVQFNFSVNQEGEHFCHPRKVPFGAVTIWLSSMVMEPGLKLKIFSLSFSDFIFAS